MASKSMPLAGSTEKLILVPAVSFGSSRLVPGELRPTMKPAAPSDPPAPAPATPRLPLEGELYLLPTSPWSQRVVLTIRHARANVAVREFRPMMTEMMIWARQGFPRGLRVTSPVMHRPGLGWVMDSHAIARAVDTARAPSAPTLFPAEHDAALRRLVALAETVQNFFRGRFVKLMQDDPQIFVDLFLPRLLRAMPFAKALARGAVAQFGAKYKPESDAAQEADARSALEEVTETLRKAPVADGMRYAVGGSLSYADFALALAIALVPNEASFFKDVPVTEPDFEGEFPEVREYVAAILKKHVSKEDVKFPPPSFNSDGNVV